MDQQIFERYARRPVPRYTSYPTAPHFSSGVGAGHYRAWLAALAPGRRGSLYLHVPFCRSMCWYCGCHTSVAARRAPIDRYVEALQREAALVAEALPRRLAVDRIHFGGGTPTMMAPEQVTALMALLRGLFHVGRAAEIAIEIDPRTLTAAMAAALGAAGFSRASIGVQCFGRAVQEAINRLQSFEETAAAVAGLRAAGVTSVNFDLIYGLPRQTVASCLATVEQALTLRPDRLAVFGYAHVPDFKPHQAKLTAADLPGASARLEQARVIAAALREAGYVEIGLDHFARPDDALARAAAAGRLRRNFQGYTDDRADALIGLGASSISRLPAGFAQNAVRIPDYERRVAAGELPVGRGYAVSADDRLRGAIIERIMCDHRVDLEEIRRAQGAAPGAGEPEALDELLLDGLVTRNGSLIEVSRDARPLVRSVAAAFDAYLHQGAARHAAAV